MTEKKRIRGIVLFSLLTVISVFVLYCFLGAPSLTPEMAMHQMESQELIGPSRIIARGELRYDGYDHFLLGETEYGYCLYEYYEGYQLWNDVLTYAEKTGNATVFSLGAVQGNYGDVPDERGLILPVFAIPGEAGAVTARLTLETKSDRDPIYEELLTVEAELQQGVYFLFEVETKDMYIDVRQFWANRFQNYNSSYAYISGTATLELYDRQGTPIDTIVMEFPATT